MPTTNKRKIKTNEANPESKKTTLPQPNKKRKPSDIIIEKAYSFIPVEAKKGEEDTETNNRDPEDENPSVETNNPGWSTDQSEYIKNLEKANDLLESYVRTIMTDRSIMVGQFDDWPEIHVDFWSSDLKGIASSCSDWGYFHGKPSEDGEYKYLSKKQKNQLINSLQGYVVQEDFDTIIPRLPPALRPNILGLFVGIIMIKEILDLFFTNPFWYLEWPNSAGSDESEESSFTTLCGAQLNDLYHVFRGVNLQLANHWRAQMIRLCNAKIPNQRKDPALVLKNCAFREAKIKQFVADKFADKNFQLLLKDSDDPTELSDRERTFYGVYHRAAELAVGLATAQPGVEWQTLEEIPPTFSYSSKDVETITTHQLNERDLRLNGHRILALTMPVFWRTNEWNRHGKDRVLRKGSVLVDDPKGPPLCKEDQATIKRKDKENKKARKAQGPNQRNKADEEKQPQSG